MPTRLLACSWGERKALLRDEERAAGLEVANTEICNNKINQARVKKTESRTH